MNRIRILGCFASGVALLVLTIGWPASQAFGSSSNPLVSASIGGRGGGHGSGHSSGGRGGSRSSGRSAPSSHGRSGSSSFGGSSRSRSGSSSRSAPSSRSHGGSSVFGGSSHNSSRPSSRSTPQSRSRSGSSTFGGSSRSKSFDSQQRARQQQLSQDRTHRDAQDRAIHSSTDRSRQLITPDRGGMTPSRRTLDRPAPNVKPRLDERSNPSSEKRPTLRRPTFDRNGHSSLSEPRGGSDRLTRPTREVPGLRDGNRLTRTPSIPNEKRFTSQRPNPRDRIAPPSLRRPDDRKIAPAPRDFNQRKLAPTPLTPNQRRITPTPRVPNERRPTPDWNKRNNSPQPKPHVRKDLRLEPSGRHRDFRNRGHDRHHDAHHHRSDRRDHNDHHFHPFRHHHFDHVDHHHGFGFYFLPYGYYHNYSYFYYSGWYHPYVYITDVIYDTTYYDTPYYYDDYYYDEVRYDSGYDTSYITTNPFSDDLGYSDSSDEAAITFDESWNLLADGYLVDAQDGFAELIDLYPFDAEPLIGYSIASGLLGEYEESVFAMRDAVDRDPGVLSVVPLNLSIERLLGRLVERYEGLMYDTETASDARFMIAAIRYALDQEAIAFFMVDDAINNGDTAKSTLRLREEVRSRMYENLYSN